MPPKARFNDKARAGGLAKAQAIRDARKHGRKLPQGDAPKSKKQKRIDKYIDSKLRNDEKVRLINKLGEQTKIEGLSSTKVMKRTKGQDKKQDFGTFTGFDTMSLDNDEAESDDSESYLQADLSYTSGSVGAVQITNGTVPSTTGSKRVAPAFGFAAKDTPATKRPKKALRGYTWRAKLEQDKRRKSGISSESESDESSSSELDAEATIESTESSDRHEAEMDQKTSAFRQWASEQTGSATVDLEVSELNSLHEETYVPRPRSISPEAEETSDLEPPTLTPVEIPDRPQSLILAREALPAFQSQHDLIGMVKSHSIVIVTGGTGSGKTTQIPQYLYEAGFKGIGITQPRRVAAVSVAQRVAKEMGSLQGAKVAHQIQFESTVSPKTEIKFMTEGILLRELCADFLLSKYEIIMLDEAHERSINTDVLIGMLSRVIRVRNDRSHTSMKPLRVVIMSATLRESDFRENRVLFPNAPPTISIPASEAPVTIHFSKRTEEFSYVEEAAKKICKIHKKLPPGDILVFLTGQQEIDQCITLLQEELQESLLYNGPKVIDKGVPSKNRKKSLNSNGTKAGTTSRHRDEDDIVARNDIDLKLQTGGDDYEHDSDSDISDIDETDQDKALSKDQRSQIYVEILPLYSSLKTEEQLKIFTTAPAQCRRIIVSTNVAETSLTIPGIRYVVDSGRAKYRRFKGNVEKFEINWISKASADQRKGRAGRTGHGHVYRLYSSAVFDDKFPDFLDPEILHTPLDGVMLQLKSVLPESIPISKFPFPTAPSDGALTAAMRLLKHLKALDAHDKITQVGEAMSRLALTPRLAKMVVEVIQLVQREPGQRNLIPYIVAFVSAMSVDDSLIREVTRRKEFETGENRQAVGAFERKKKEITASRLRNNFLELLAVIYAFDNVEKSQQSCINRYFPVKTMCEITELRSQITNRIKTNFNLTANISPNLCKSEIPTTTQLDDLLKILGTAFVDQICIRATDISTDIYATPYIPLWPLDNGQEFAYIHRSCTNLREAPKCLLFSSLSMSANQPGDLHTVKKVRITVLAPLEKSWIASIAEGTGLLRYSDPISQNPADIEILDNGRERRVPVRPNLSINGSGRQGWELPAIRITQKLVGTRWVNK